MRLLYPCQYIVIGSIGIVPVMMYIVLGDSVYGYRQLLGGCQEAMGLIMEMDMQLIRDGLFSPSILGKLPEKVPGEVNRRKRPVISDSFPGIIQVCIVHFHNNFVTCFIDIVRSPANVSFRWKNSC